jgi:hypothetical protein
MKISIVGSSHFVAGEIVVSRVNGQGPDAREVPFHLLPDNSLPAAGIRYSMRPNLTELRLVRAKVPHIGCAAGRSYSYRTSVI